MTEELDVIDAELEEMDDDTIAVVCDQEEGIPTNAERTLELHTNFTLDDFWGETIYYLDNDPVIGKKVDNAEWGTLYPDGKDHLEGMKHKLKNEISKARRRGRRL